MTIVKTYDLLTITNGTAITTSTAGTGDEAATVVGVGQTCQSNTVQLASSASIGFVGWDALDLGSYGIRQYVKLGAGTPTSGAGILNAWNTADVKAWSLTLSSGRNIQVRNGAGTTLSTSSLALAVDTWYEIEIWVNNDTDALRVRVYTPTGTLVYTKDTAYGNEFVNLGRIQFGKHSTFQLGSILQMRNLAVADVAANIGPYEAYDDGDTFTIGWTYVASLGAAEQTMLLNGYWNGTSLDPLEGVQWVADTEPPTSRHAYTWPFAGTAMQNLCIGTDVEYETASDTQTAMLRNATAMGHPPQLNRDRWSVAAALATTADPIRTLLDVKSGISYSIRVPAGTAPTAGTDKHVGICQPAMTYAGVNYPAGVLLFEAYKFNQVPATGTPTSYTSTYVNVTDLRGDGLARGSRASGISFFTGLIRKHEIDGNYIPHVIALGIDPDLLKPDPPMSGQPAWTSYDGKIKQSSTGINLCVWPARLRDTQIPPSSTTEGNLYTGVIPMGTMFAIPSSVDLRAITPALSPEGMALATALQDYGALVVVASATCAVFVEPNVGVVDPDVDFAAIRMREDWQSSLFGLLVRVKNNDPGTLNSVNSPIDSSGVAGGGDRLLPPAPPMIET